MLVIRPNNSNSFFVWSLIWFACHQVLQFFSSHSLLCFGNKANLAALFNKWLHRTVLQEIGKMQKTAFERNDAISRGLHYVPIFGWALWGWRKPYETALRHRTHKHSFKKFSSQLSGANALFTILRYQWFRKATGWIEPVSFLKYCNGFLPPSTTISSQLMKGIQPMTAMIAK